MKLTIKSDNQVKIIDLNKDLELSAVKGEQYVFSNGFASYTLNFKDDQQTVSLQFNVDGKVIKVDLKGIVPFLQENSSEIENPTAIIINKTINEGSIDNVIQNDAFNGSEIIDKLEALITNPVDLGKDLTLISDFQTLIEALDAAAAGGEQGTSNTNASSFNSIFSPLEDSLNDIGETDIWENLSESISSIPVDTGNEVIATVLDTTATPAPTVVITEDANDDGLISKAELDGKVDVTITVPTEANVGDTLNVKNPDGTTTTVEITADIKANGYTTSYDKPADGSTITVSATITDTAGNTSAEGKDSAIIGDTTATPAPTVVITEDVNNDGTISNTELVGKIDVTITVPTEANVGDTLNVKNPDGTTTTVEITADIKANGYTTSYDKPADGSTITVSATITDTAGNTSAEGKDSAIIGDTTATPAPTVVITEDVNNDGTISNTELVGKIDVTITVPTEANVGDTLNVKNPDGTTTTVEITADIKANGYTTSYDKPADGSTITVSATITDTAGNTSAEGKDSAIIGDTTATPAPIVVITEDVNNDGTISNTELVGKIDVTITVPTEANVGDTLNVKNPDGTTTTVEITADIKANGYTTSYDKPADGSTITVSATITDTAGNTSAEGKDSAIIGDTTATPAPIVVITEDVNNDGTISNTELVGKIDVTITVPTEANVGDTLNVKNPDGTTTTVEITADIKANGYTTSYDKPADGSTITVSATITDTAGNTSAEGKDSAIIGDTTATPAPIVVITEDVNNDGTISNTELVGKIDVTITVPTEANVGDTLNVKNPDGTTTTVEITADIKANGYTTSYDKPADGSTITVSATITDTAGNTSAEGKDSAIIGDTTATPAPTVVITEDVNNDGTISNTELDGKVDVTITVPTEANVGDTLNVKNPDGTTTTVEITADIKANGYTTSYDKPADGSTITVSATITDTAGNTSAEGKDSAIIGDTTATPAPTVVITEDVNNDGTISNTELVGKVDVTITVPTEANVGDTLNVKNPDGTTTTVTITDEIKNSGYTTSYDKPADGSTITVSATITDTAGNTSAEGKDSAIIGDTTATPAPTVVITEDVNNDGTISNTELDGKVDVTITVPTEANVGDTLNVKNPDGTTTTVTITDEIKNSGYTTSYDKPADGSTITVSATITDTAGNTSAEGKDSAIIGDTTATPAPTVVITEDVNNDGTISNTELDGKVDVTITVPTEANVGDTLNVKNPDGTTTTVTITDEIKNSGYKTSYDAPAEDGTITVSATITDKAGNTSAEGSDSAVLKLNVAPPEAEDRHFELDCQKDDVYTIGLKSEYYGVNTQISNLTQFKSIVSSNNPDATFTATKIDYGYGIGDVSKGTNLQAFLKNDASSLSNDPADTTDGGIHMYGKVFLTAGSYNFKVYADDGYDILINGQSVASFENNQAPATKVHDQFTIAQDGYYDIEMFWWDQGGAYVFKPEISSDGGLTYKTLDSTMLFTQIDDSTNNTNKIEFTLEDFVSDIEDDSTSTIVKIKIVSLPEDGILTVNGNPVQIGDIFDEKTNIVYTPNANQEDTLYGTMSDVGTLSEWGTVNNGVLTTDDGKAIIKAYTNGTLGEVGFASENNNHSHDGLGLGVVGSTDNDQIESTANEKIVIEFKEIVTKAEFGLASLGGNFTPGNSADANAHWVAYKDGVKVAEGDVKQSIDDSNPTTNTFKINVEFDKIEFTTTANVNSNYSIQYMNVDYKIDDSFNYISIDSDGFESEKATVTFDIDSKCNIIPKTTNDSIITDEDTSYTIKVEDFGNYSDSSTSSFIKVMIVDLPTNGVLKLNGAVISENTEILKSDIDSGKLVFKPTENTDLDSSFSFKISNGTLWSESYTTDVNIKAVADAPTARINVTKLESSSTSEELIVKVGSTTYDINDILVNKGSYVEVKNIGNNTETSAQNIVVNENLDSNDFLKTSSNNNIIVINGDISGGAKIEPMGGNDFIAILGDLINGTINDSSGIHTLYLDKSSSYYSWTVNAHSGDTGMDGTITQYADEAHTQIVGTLYINNIDGIIFADGHTVGSVEVISTPSTTVDYEVDISAALVDLDGSETLTVTITNVPTGATLSSDTYTLTDNGDNTWSVTIPAGTKSITDTITMSVPETKTDNINLGITARATETNDNNDGLNYKESSDLANVVSPFDVKLGSANTLVTQVSTSTTQGAISKPARLEDIENVNTTVIGDTVTTYENMNLAHYSNSGNFNDVIEVNGNSNYIETRGGNDTINVDGNQNGTIDAGEGNNRIDIDGNAGTIYVGNNDDSIRIGSNANSSIDLREGTNIIDVLGNSNSIYSGSGNDTIIVDGSVNGVISSGYGADRIDIGGNVSGMIDSNDGDDVVTIGGTTYSSVYLGGGNDILEITGNADQNIDAGTGNDTIAVKGHVNGYIDLAAGGDTLYTSDYVNGIIFAGEGNDSVILGGYIKNDVRGGSGADSIELTKYSKIDWDTNKDGVKDKVQEFENIKFSDGTIIGNLSAFSSSMTTYEYPVVVSILNNDLDSETITEVKVSFENLPIDGKIYQNGVELIPNNGEYTLNANDLTNIKISSSEQILDESGFKINVCATSTESNGGNIAIKNLNTLFIGDEDNDDTIDFSTAINNKTDIDVVDIKGTNVNTKLKIDIEDLVADTDKELIIKGEFEGKVDLNDGNDGQKSWENSGTENLDGSTYNVYIGTGVNSTVKLLIEDDIEIIPDI